MLTMGCSVERAAVTSQIIIIATIIIFLYSIINRNYTPTDIDIYTAKIDAEQKLGKGKLGYGAKTSLVTTKNTFDFFNDNANGVPS